MLLGIILTDLVFLQFLLLGMLVEFNINYLSFCWINHAISLSSRLIKMIWAHLVQCSGQPLHLLINIFFSSHEEVQAHRCNNQPIINSGSSINAPIPESNWQGCGIWQNSWKVSYLPWLLSFCMSTVTNIHYSFSFATWNHHWCKTIFVGYLMHLNDGENTTKITTGAIC